MMRAGWPGIDDAQRRAVLHDGVVQIRHALALRPVSPYSWAVLLQLKNSLGEYDAEFRRSLERTTTLGPYEPALQVAVAAVGFDAWKVLPDAERKIVGEAIRRGLQHQAGAIFATARAHLNDCPPDSRAAGCRQ